MDVAVIWHVVEGLIGLIMIVVWWNFKELKKQVDGIQDDQARYKLHVAEHYVTQNDLSKAIDALSRAIDAIFKKLDRIEDKLDLKADK
jgi:hypothetical protein